MYRPTEDPTNTTKTQTRGRIDHKTPPLSLGIFAGDEERTQDNQSHETTNNRNTHKKNKIKIIIKNTVILYYICVAGGRGRDENRFRAQADPRDGDVARDEHDADQHEAAGG